MKKPLIRFIDCGANIGQSADWALSFFSNRDILIDSFEPLPQNYLILKDKFKDEERVRTHNFAISDSSKDKKFYCQNWGARTGSSLILGKSSINENDNINVQCIDIADWIISNISEAEIPIFKIDIEGSEYEVLPHLFENNIHNLVKYWLVEFHPKVKVPNYNEAVIKESKEKLINLCDWALDHESAEKMLFDLK